MPLVPLALVLASAAPVTVSAPALVPQQTDASALVHVAVVTDSGGDPEELAARRESVADLIKALSSKSKKKVLTVVTESEADATESGEPSLLIEVIDRGVQTPRFVIGLTPRPGRPGSPVGPVRTAVLRVKVTFGSDDDPVELTNKNKPSLSPNGWKSAAENLADQIQKLVGTWRQAASVSNGG